MEVIPAIDLKGGRCVRLRQGDFVQETVFSDDPLATARSWQEQGAGRLHLVDLDGAAGGEPAHLEVITAIVRSLTIPVQVGGGIRTVAAAEAWLAAGADRVVIGTAAVRNPNMVKKLCQLHGGHRVVAAADARDGKVAVQGWTEASEIDVLDLAGDMAAIGVERLLYTDIARDGMLSGPDLETNTLLAPADHYGGAGFGRGHLAGRYSKPGRYRRRGRGGGAGVVYRGVGLGPIGGRRPRIDRAP